MDLVLRVNRLNYRVDLCDFIGEYLLLEHIILCILDDDDFLMILVY